MIRSLKRDSIHNLFAVAMLSILMGLAAGCSEDDAKDISPVDTVNHDYRLEPGDIADDVKADLSREPEDAVDALANDTSDVSPDGTDAVEIVEIKEEDDGCHTACYGGLKCENGAMHAATSAPIPCWVDSEADCFEHGAAHPCLSGECGESICKDDEEASAVMLSESGEILDGQVEYGLDSVQNSRIFLFDQYGTLRLDLTIDWTSSNGQEVEMEGTSNFVVRDISSFNLSLVVDEVPLEVTTATLTLLIQKGVGGMDWLPETPDYAGAIDAVLFDGRRFRAAWRGTVLPGCLSMSCAGKQYGAQYSMSVE